MQRTLSATDTAAVGPSAAYGAPEGGPALPPRISWGAVIAGAVVAVIVGLMLNVLGVAVGASAIDVADRDTPSGTTFSVVGGLWLLAANLIGLAVGGYVAARFSGTADDTDGVLHGLSVWGIGYLLSAVLLGNIIAGTTSTAMQGASSILGGAAQGAGQAASAATGQAAQGVDPRQLVERARTALQTGGDPARMSSEQRNTEIGTLVTRRVTDGNLARGRPGPAEPARGGRVRHPARGGAAPRPAGRGAGHPRGAGSRAARPRGGGRCRHRRRDRGLLRLRGDAARRRRGGARRPPGHAQHPHGASHGLNE